ncbi:uncharacterized protein LOC123871354 [Maniola jurtina]|uniref:uncharacterized protein LOC123871354 n=1 Tax=Maniola jurtina TaxID=191418 RepID=UPI001E686BC0|nr:uncharacterized protein LOC123871354 [Maniola jurtina]
MDIDEDVINKFANALRNHHVQRTVSLYSENRSSGNSDTEKYEIKDIILCVAKQLKAIQNADNLKNRPSGKGIPDQVKKSSFLPIHMVPVEQPPKQGQSHKFETQCILDTQLINIIDNAEAIIDAEKGITQEFDTTFCHKDLEQSVDDKLINISQKSNTVFKDSGTVDNDKSKSPDKTDCQLDRDETNLQLHDCSFSDNNTVKHIDAEKRMIQEFDTTFSFKDLDKYIEEKNDCNENQENGSNNVREKNMGNDNIQAGNYRESEYVITDDTFKTKNEKEDLFVNKLSLTKERTIADITCRNFVPTSNTQRINIDVCDNFDTQCKFYLDTCESDSDSQNKELKKYSKSIEEEPKSPILNKIRRKEKSNTPSPLIFELETFEKFEAIALPVIENHDFETAKRVINSQILNRELFIYTHAEAVLSDRDKDIQIRSSILESDKEPEFSYNTCTDNKLHLKEDSMLFSSDEENDVQYNVKELPLTCAIHNSFPDEPYILDKTMYVGFQTASNKSIQISTDSYCKAKSIFNNFENIESENLSGTNIEALNTKVTTSNVDKLDHVNMNDETNNNYDDIAHCFETAIGETFNVFEHKESISNINENKIKNNAENQSDDVENLPQLHDNNIMSANKILKLREVKETSKSCADVGFSSTGKTKDNNFDSNFADYLKFDDHILEEFNTDLIPEVTLNKIDELTKGDINDFAGFKTANNKMIKISTQALMKTRNIFEDINSDDNLSRKSGKQSSENLYSLHRRKSETISTAGITPNIYLKSPSKSWSSHTKAPSNSKLMNASNQNNVKNKEDLISTDNKEIKLKYVTPCRFEKLLNDDYNKSHTRHICSTKEIDPFAKSKKVFQGTDDEESNTVQDSHISKHIALKSLNTAMCQGFKTAANKPVGISAEALAKSKKIFQNIDDEERNTVKDSDNSSKEKQPYPIAHTSLNTATCQGFKTATNKPVKISAEALAKSKKIFLTIDDEGRNESENTMKEKQPYPIARTSQNAICQGFKTATNKPVKISAEALAKSKKVFQTIDDEGRNESENTMKEKQPYPFARTSQNAICQGFKTAGNKPVEISEDALAKSKKIFENMDKDCERKQIPGEVVEKQPDIFPKRQRNFIGFDTASNKKVKVSENALLQSRHVLRNTNLDLKNDNCIFKSPSNLDTHKIKATDKSVCNFAFKTGNNTQINISEEALKKSRNMFSDLDESIQANADPKLNLGDVISEKDILEDFNTEVIKDFENTVYTEDFIKTETPKSKRSGSPILSCPKSKKSKKFETPINVKKFVAPINRQSTIKTDTTNLYSFDENYKKIKNYTLKDLNEIEKIRTIKDVDPYILDFRFETLLDFEFMGDRNDIDNDRWTTDKIKAFFTDSVNKRIIPQGWIENHLKMIIWKLVCYEIRFPGVMKNICTVKNVLEQLKYRYKRELYNVERPILRKIMEKDEVSSKLMILSVSGLFVDGVSVYSVTNQNQNIELLLTDGWYTIKASTDRMIDRLVCEGKISVGTKLAIHGAELLNCEQGIAPWEDTSSIRLKISGNSTRRAKWDARLGLHGNGAMLSRLSAVKPEGGRVSQLRTLVTRVYPTLYIEKFPDGSTLTRSERLEHIHQMKYETERQIQMEKLYEELERFSDQESQDSDGQCLEDRAMESGSQISRLMKKSSEPVANLTSSQAHLLQQHSLKQKEKLVQALQDKFQELVKKRGLDTPRNVVPLMKIRIADVETGGVTKAMVTIWKPNETLQEILTEGTWIDLYNVVPTSVRYSEIQISAGRQSVFRRSKLNETDKLKTLTKTLKRQCYTTKDLQNPSMNTDYNEVDTVGLIFMIEPQTMEFETKNQPFQNVYLTDENKNIICVNFWGGIKKFGFQNILDTCQIVACVNLQKRAGNSRKNIPQYRATEFTYFTKTPKNDSIRKLADDLTAKFSSLDKRKFIDDCVALKNNYHNLKCGNTENVSPYRLNTSDYNVYKNKVYIDSPLVNKCTDVNFNLTGLDFESTFKQSDTQDLSPQMLLRKRKVNEKIAKLKMYGEPPPLSPIHLINKSSNAAKAFKSPLTKNDISTSVASPSSLPQNKGENKSSLDCQQNKCKDGESKMEGLAQNGEYKPCVTSANALPQNRVDKVDSSPVLSVNRTYVKRASINPVKLNFDNAIETSITDPFAEDFDGSPPLSLDVDFAS